MRYPSPLNEEPDDEQMMEWYSDSGSESTDGCWVEPDGICPHGYPSWFLQLGCI